MGTEDRLLAEREARDAEALALLLESGALRESELRPGTYERGSRGLEAAYELARLRTPQGESVDDIIARIDAVYEDVLSVEASRRPSRD